MPRRPFLNYILDADHNPVAMDIRSESMLLVWSTWFANPDNRRVALDEIAPGVEVSTVFLGLDHNWFGEPPILFETMVFDDYGGNETRRYATWADAEAGHREIVARLRARLLVKGKC